LARSRQACSMMASSRVLPSGRLDRIAFSERFAAELR
jgi:hypothetical protein